MRIKVLGSSAGGGFPQWNCNCANCSGIRNQTIPAKTKTQSSIAIDLDNDTWILINASPDIKHQLSENILDSAQKKIRFNPIAAIILLDSQLDHITGLLSLREADSLNIYATKVVFDELNNDFPILKILRNYSQIHEHVIQQDKTFFIAERPEYLFTPIFIAGQAPPYSRNRGKNIPGTNVGLLITDQQSNKKIFYSPGLAEITPELEKLMSDVDWVLIDGTFWVEDEMIKTATGTKMAAEMGHIPVGTNAGLLSYLDNMTKPKKYLIHINNTNPVLNANSPEYQELKRHGVELAYDGMEIIL